MSGDKLRVALIGGGRLGQHYAEVYNTLENTELVAIAECNDERREIVGERFGVKALFKDAEEMLQKMDETPDLAVVVTPSKYMKDAVIAAAQGGVRGVSTDKPIGARLCDVDEMAVSGHDLRQSLEVAIAAKFSALWGSVPLALPLEDRSLTLYPRPYRWLGGDQSDRYQTAEEARTYELFAKG